MKSTHDNLEAIHQLLIDPRFAYSYLKVEMNDSGHIDAWVNIEGGIFAKTTSTDIPCVLLNLNKICANMIDLDITVLPLTP